MAISFHLLSKKIPFPPLAERLFSHWWVLAIKGILLVALWIFALVFPEISFVLLIIYLGVIIFFVGGFLIWAAILHRKRNKVWKIRLVEGIVDVVIGILITFYPILSGKFLIFLLAIWAIAMGVVYFLRFIKHKEYKVILLISGLLAVTLGAMILLFPTSGTVTLVYILALFAIIFGITLIFFAWKLRWFAYYTHEHLRS